MFGSTTPEKRLDRLQAIIEQLAAAVESESDARRKMAAWTESLQEATKANLDELVRLREEKVETTKMLLEMFEEHASLLKRLDTVEEKLVRLERK